MPRSHPLPKPRLMPSALAFAALAGGGLGLLLVGAEPAWTDDTNLFRESGANPYVFILLDTSGSMNQTVQTTACPASGCVPRLIGDDPDSKIRVAKEVLHDLMDEARDVNFGFASFNEDDLRARFKHWWYELRSAAGNTGIDLGGGQVFPEPGRQDLFGQTWACTSGGADDPANANPPDSKVGCLDAGRVTPADLNDPWEVERMKRLPKLGDGGTASVTFYIRSGAASYRVIYSNPAGVTQRPGDASLRVQVRVDRCNDINTGCGTVTPLVNGTKTLTFDKREEMIYWEPGEGVGRAFPKVAYFGNGVRFLNAANGCSGWDPNTDTAADRHAGVNFRHDTVADPDGRGAPFNQGDVLPLDWNGRPKRVDIKARMSPKPGLPDFRIATYFEDHPRPGEDFLRLKDANRRPMFPDGGTPTGESMQDFRDWYNTWRVTATGSNGDRSFSCRKTYLLVMTDGLASCGEQNPPAGQQPRSCVVAKDLREQFGIRTYIVGLGDILASPPPGFVNNLACVADNGGTGPGDVDGDGKPDGPGPLLPKNKQQLSEALSEIFKQIRAESRTFASAAVPSVQAEAQDKTYLSSFSPRNDASYWPGRVDSYLKPVPSITVNGRQIANRGQRCGPGDTSECLLWDGGEEMLDQAPAPADLAAATPDFKIGLGSSQRRVFYALANPGGTVPAARRSFVPPATPAEQADLVAGMGAGSFAAAVDVIEETLVKKTADINDPITNDPVTIEFVLGDVFHSDPQVVGAPNRFRYFAEDVATDPCTATSKYRCFFERHEFRRKMLILGANDGQFHAFDAGLPVKRIVGGQTEIEFDNGTGKEIFSFIPRASLPVLRRLSEGSLHELSVDGSPVVDDFFIDPVNSLVDPPDPGEREWRTVVLGGMREGGRAYYALDVTQPDELDADGIAAPISGTYVPSCIDGGGGCGPLPFPAVLWEFTDTADEDGNGAPDLGDTWSKPNSGRIRVLENGRPAVKFVAIFGGGLDAVYKQQPVDPATGEAREPSGNFLYMVDVETGKVLYKRRLDLVAGATIPASAPSEPAAVDTDQDGFLDTVYIGNTAGYLYKVDLRTTPAIDPVTKRITAAEWEPFAVFSTGGRPLYFPPAVLFVGSLGKYALAFGTGDREDLWSDTTQEGRFYILLDDDFGAGNSLPVRTEINYTGISGEITVSPNLAEGTNFLVNPPAGKSPGYFLRLGVKERVITRAFALAGITVFSSYVPESRPAGELCAQGGESHLFVVLTTNGNSVQKVGTPARDSRYRVVRDLVTSPYVEQSATKNEPPEGRPPTANPCAGMEQVTKTLQNLLPAACRFANYTTNLMTIRSDTGIECIAPVPVCIVEKNWKEF